MKWKQPPIIKIYEALGAIADGRVEREGMVAKVYSSSRNKFYNVSYDSEKRAIMCNDNGSFWKGYLGYPAIAFLMLIGEINYSDDIALLLKDIAWKDINQQFKNDFDKTLVYILKDKTEEERAKLEQHCSIILERIQELDLSLLGAKSKPPEGY